MIEQESYQARGWRQDTEVPEDPKEVIATFDDKEASAKDVKQAGTELWQAQFSLGLAKLPWAM